MKISSKSLFSAIFICVVSILTYPAATNAQFTPDNGYNPNRILEDNEILDYNALDLSGIQNFLNSRPGTLKNYVTANAYGETKTAAEIIYNATHNNYDCAGVDLGDQPTASDRELKCRKITTVSPKLLLVLLQKEASLIDDPNPSAGRLDAATGYGCPTGQGCNPYWKGFGKQVNSAALQFLAYMKEPQKYGFKVGGTYIAKDKYSKLQTIEQAMAKPATDPHSYNKIIASADMVTVTPANQATAALYNYTPHVYNGNYNTHLLWDRYFGTTEVPTPPSFSRVFPDGSVIKAEGDPRIWLITGGQRRHFANWSTFITRFKPSQIVNVSQTELNNYPEGPAIKFSNYSLVKTSDQTIYLLVDKEKRPFASAAVFKSFGFNPDEVETATTSDLSEYKVGSTITATSTYVTGALVKDSKSQEVFYLDNNIKHPVSSEILAVKYPDRPLVKKTPTELAKYKTGDPILLDDGALVKTNNYPTVYLISNGKKRPLADEAAFIKYGYNFSNVMTLSSQFLYNYDMGTSIQ